ncbi:pentapeptide repeat-containing protein [Enterocloster aldenensis]|uniref:pentapeptide repeat-containing protein n=1 Tax=Enterocloster aldenensis TaxID=358742 RepID=UPI0040259611
MIFIDCCSFSFVTNIVPLQLLPDFKGVFILLHSSLTAFSRRVLPGASLSGAALSDASLSSASLPGAALPGAALSGASLPGAASLTSIS